MAGLQGFVQKRAGELMKKYEKDIVAMIKDQHEKGLGGDGSTMQTGYSPGYAKVRKRKGLQTKFVDLHFTGDYHKNMEIVPQKDGADVQSKVPYSQYIRVNFPEGVKLTKENAEAVAQMLAPELSKDIRKYLIA